MLQLSAIYGPYLTTTNVLPRGTHQGNMIVFPQRLIHYLKMMVTL